MRYVFCMTKISPRSTHAFVYSPKVYLPAAPKLGLDIIKHTRIPQWSAHSAGPSK
jgi:hypothetical protein